MLAPAPDVLEIVQLPPAVAPSNKDGRLMLPEPLLHSICVSAKSADTVG